MKEYFSSSEQKKFLKYFDAREKISEIEISFYERAYKYVDKIKWLPWLQMIWIWNSISMNSAKKTSDIDLFIVTSINSMWFVRIMITMIFGILWVRKTAKKHAWRFCLSFFTTRDWLNFSDWKIENDIYLYFWVLYFKPILDYNNTYDFFIKENEKWADFKDYENIIIENKTFIKYKKNTRVKSNIFISWLDKIFKTIFLPKTLRHYEKLWKPYWIIIDDNMLKFHDWDIRKDIKRELVDIKK